MMCVLYMCVKVRVYQKQGKKKENGHLPVLLEKDH